MTKVVTCQEMQRIEKLCASTSELMDRAAEALLNIVLPQAPKDVVLLVGKGNKGGDALSLGALLLQQNIPTRALLIYPENQLNSLCAERLEKFKRMGGAVHSFHPATTSFIVDGLLGTGFRGVPEAPITAAIQWANSQNSPVLAIDVPSGLDGSTGEVPTIAIQATFTCSLGLPKIGCFVGQGWNHVGTFLHRDIGIPHEVVSQATPTALLLNPSSLYLPPIKRTRHKYEAGYVLGISGSLEMPGAAALSSLATLRSGAGIVRLFTHADTPSALLAPEVIRETFDLNRIEEEQKRASALFIGPGLGRSSEVRKWMQKLLPRLTKPAVIDGDGLYHLCYPLPSHSILTPHSGEMTRLLNAPPTLDNCQQWVETHRTTLILKGAPTFLFHPAKQPLIITAGDPGMATAGSGDVLTGITAALLAQKMLPEHAAPLAVYLHGRAGELAAAQRTSYSLIASDLIYFLPQAVAELL